MDPQSTVEEDKAALHLLNTGPLGSSSLKPPRRFLQSKPNDTRIACAVFGDTIKRCQYEFGRLETMAADSMKQSKEEKRHLSPAYIK